uniref:Putative: trypsin-like serine protease n=1 Tax=Anopheles aquasalis TaxID=42839 RepID=T1E8V4_ANOAQ
MLVPVMSPYRIRMLLLLIYSFTRAINLDRSKTILPYWCSAIPSRTISIFDRSVCLKARAASKVNDVNRRVGVRSAGVYSNIMKMITVPVLPQSRCSSLLVQAGHGEHFALPNQFLCAGGEKSVDMCNGDGGSPLVCPTADGSYKLAGIVS